MDPIRERLRAPTTQPKHDSLTDLDTMQLTDDILSEIPVTIDQDNETKQCTSATQHPNDDDNVAHTDHEHNTDRESKHADGIQPSTKKEKIQSG